MIKGKEILNANGILGTGICLDAACRADMEETNQATNELKRAQAAAISSLTNQQPQNNNTLIIIVVLVAVVVIGVGVYLLIRKKKA